MRPRRDDGSEGGVGERPGALRSTDGCCGIHPFLPRSAKTKGEKNLGCSYAQRHSSRRSVSVLRIAFATERSGVLRCGAAPKRCRKFVDLGGVGALKKSSGEKKWKFFQNVCAHTDVVPSACFRWRELGGVFFLPARRTFLRNSSTFAVTKLTHGRGHWSGRRWKRHELQYVKAW